MPPIFGWAAPATGVPTVQPPRVAALTSATNQAGSAQQAAAPSARAGDKDRPSIIIVDFLGFGGGETDEEKKPRGEQGRRQDDERRSQSGSQGLGYDATSVFHVIGNGRLTQELSSQLSDRANRRDRAAHLACP